MFITPAKESLTKEELKRLDAFLKLPFSEATPLSLTALHGFFCAILSAPHLIMPSEWQPVVFGGEPEFSSIEEAQDIISLIMRLNNQTSCQLRGEQPFHFLLWDNNETIVYEESSLKLLAEWCEGYLRGTRVDPLWSLDNYAIAKLFPLGVLANRISVKGEKDNEGKIIEDDEVYKERYKAELLDYIQENYNYWSEERKNPVPIYGESADRIPYQRSEEKIGRNELCPCDSGRKYKRCCGSSTRILH